MKRAKFSALGWNGQAGTQMTQGNLIGKGDQKSRREVTISKRGKEGG